MSVKKKIVFLFLSIILLIVCSIIKCSCNTKPVAVIIFSPSSPKVGETVTLDGTHSYDDDGDTIIRYEWSVTGPPGSSPVLSDTLGPVVTLTTNAAGLHTVSLTVSDGDFAIGTAMNIKFNDPALANAGPDLTADVGIPVPLDGSASFDLLGRSLTYTWSRIEGVGTIQLTNSNQAVASLVFAEPDTHIFQLHVEIDQNIFANDTMLVIANPPVITGFSPTGGDIGQMVIISGKNFSSISGGSIISFNNTPTTASTATKDQLAVTVPNGATTGPISVQIAETGRTTTTSQHFTVSGLVASAGSDTTVDVGTAVTLDATASQPSPGDTLSYQWQLVSKPNLSATSISNSTFPVTFMNIDEPGTYEVELRVTGNNTGATGRDTVNIFTDFPEITDFSPDSGFAGVAVTIKGKNFSSHASGNVVMFSGVQALITAASDSLLTTEVPTGATTGPITVLTIANSNQASSSTNFVILDLVANAGPDQTVDAGSTVILDGSGSHGPPGQIQYHWSFVGYLPPYSNATIQDADSVTASFILDEPGTYDVRLEVTVPGGGYHSDMMQVNCHPPEITNFTPTSGPPGTPVTINGKNFSPTGVRNQVTFNTTLAWVTSASHTQLTADVPATATTGPITVKTIQNNLSATSSQNFTVTNPGSPWTVVQSGGPTLYAVDFSDNQNGLAVGNGGTILKTADGGFTWSSINSGTSKSLFDVNYAGLDTVYISGEDGTILQSVDGGVTWNSLVSGSTRDLWGVFAPDDTTAYVVGAAGTARRTLDAGLSWQSVNTGGTINYGVWFTSKLTGFVVSQQGIIRSTLNGGDNWTTRYNISGAFEAISFADSLNGTVVGLGGIIVHSTNAGVNWSAQNSGTQEMLRGVSLMTGNAQYGFVAGDNGLILRTTDGGAAWNPESSPVSYHLYDVHTFDSTTAVVVGNVGTILIRQ